MKRVSRQLVGLFTLVAWTACGRTSLLGGWLVNDSEPETDNSLLADEGASRDFNSGTGRGSEVDTSEDSIETAGGTSTNNSNQDSVGSFGENLGEDLGGDSDTEVEPNIEMDGQMHSRCSSPDLRG